MIQKFTISNFFSIREPLELSFEASKEKQYGEDWIIQIGNVRLLKLLLLYGANGSGKTNILLALDFLRRLILHVPRNSDERIKYLPFELDPAYKNVPTLFDLFFFIEETRYRYTITLSPEKIFSEELHMYTTGNSSKTIYTRKYNEEKGINIVRFGMSLDLSQKDKKTIEESTTNNITVLATYSIKNISCKELTKIRNYFKYNFFKLYYVQDGDLEVANALKDNIKLKKLLVDLLKSFHSNIVDIRVEEETQQIPESTRRLMLQMNLSKEMQEQLSNTQTITKLTGHYIHHTALGEFTLEDSLQSEGTRSFIRHLVLFYKAIQHNWLVALDEFGAGMQAKTQNLLLEFFLKFSKNSQLIIASQSLGILDFSKMRRDAIHIVSKDEIGQSSIDSETVRNIHKNIKLRKAYIDGKFKSIDPNEPDINLDTEYDKYYSLIFTEERKEVSVENEDID